MLSYLPLRVVEDNTQPFYDCEKETVHRFLRTHRGGNYAPNYTKPVVRNRHS